MYLLAVVAVLLLWRQRPVVAWQDFMAGGMKLGFQGQIYSFTSDLCSGGIFFKKPVKLDMMCTHGYFFRRSNGCKWTGSDVISGQNYVCSRYLNESEKPLVQAFIPVTAPEYPLEHTITFYDGKDNLKNLRRFTYMKGLRGKYAGRETGAVGAVVSNTHNTPETNVGSLCYTGWPDTEGGAFVVEFPFNLSNSNSETEFFTRKCKEGTFNFPMRRAKHYNFTEGYSNPEDFPSEKAADLPDVVFQEDDATSDSVTTDESTKDHATDVPVINATESGNSSGAVNGTHPQIIVIDLPEQNTDDETTESARNLTDLHNSSLVNGIGEQKVITIIDLPEKGSNEVSVDEDDESFIQLPNGQIGIPERVTDDKDLSGGNDLLQDAQSMSQILRHSPFRLKLPKESILHPDLMNWNPYIEEAVYLAKIKMVQDMEHAGGFDFNKGKAAGGSSQSPLQEQSESKWFKIIKFCGQVVKSQAPEDLVPSKFIDDALELLGYLFRNLDDVSQLYDEHLNDILASLQKCSSASTKFQATGVGCPPKFKEVLVSAPNGKNYSTELHKLPPSSSSFRSHQEDAIVAIAWSLVDYALSACYSSFTPDYVNEHHRMYVFMKETFRHERIQKRWFAAFKRVDTYVGLLSDGNYNTFMYNLDKLRAASRINSLYSDWLPKPRLMVPDYTDVNIYQLPRESVAEEYQDIVTRKLTGDNDDPFIIGNRALLYKLPFRNKVSDQLGISWRIKRDVKRPTEGPQEGLRIKREIPQQQNEWKQYEIWDGLAYCLQANYEIVGNDKLKMEGIYPSIEELRPLCEN